MLSGREDRADADSGDDKVDIECRRHLPRSPFPIGRRQGRGSQGRGCVSERFNAFLNESSRQQEPADGLVGLPLPPLPVVASWAGVEVFLTAHDPSLLVVKALIQQRVGFEGFAEQLRVEQSVASFMSQSGTNSTLTNGTTAEKRSRRTHERDGPAGTKHGEAENSRLKVLICYRAPEMLLDKELDFDWRGAGRQTSGRLQGISTDTVYLAIGEVDLTAERLPGGGGLSQGVSSPGSPRVSFLTKSSGVRVPASI